MTGLLRRITPDDIAAKRRDPIDDETVQQASAIVDSVRARGEPALREHAERLGDLPDGAPLIYDRAALLKALDTAPEQDRALLERTADRIRRFATDQRSSLADLSTWIDIGTAGHRFAPVEVTGCYAPGGRYPLPSSVLMTAVTARVAGVDRVWVASPKPAPITLAAAAVAGADALLAAGGAHAIAALAYGAGSVPRCDVVVGPGNRWVTAAKRLIFGQSGIDMLAGPSELVVYADTSADPAVLAADLLAQAEHDPDALPALVVVDPGVVDAVDAELVKQLLTLPTAATARSALEGGFAVIAPDQDAAIAACNRLAPEHLEVHTRDAAQIAEQFSHYGALFIGAGAAEVLGDYGAGPNHVLPTGGSSRFTGGLSVLAFLRMRTWMQASGALSAGALAKDAAALARHEGLEAHARAAEHRFKDKQTDAWPLAFSDVLDARARIRPHLPPTPFRRYQTLDDEVGHGIKIFVKHENHNPTNAFKARNGLSLMTALPEAARASGVVAATRGNHGQGVAWAGRLLNVPVTVCVPIGNNPEKNTAMRALGATVIEEGADYDASLLVAEALVRDRGLTMAHSTNDPNVIAGAATFTLEMLEDRPDIDALVIAVGGGSQAVGALTVARAIRPDVEVFGVQAAGAAACHDSWHAGHPVTTGSADTFADGLATRQSYALTFDALKIGLTDFITVTDAEIAAAIRLLLRTTHNLVEGAGATGMAGLIKLSERLANRTVGVVLSGGNIDAVTLARVLSGAI